MAEQESREFGKADFLLLDSVSMPDFMANLRLRLLNITGWDSKDESLCMKMRKCI
ncbi:UNVERIFIED_CONTAM: hypothetical protein K2H54_001487, partial [Gekko kuhli]